MAGHSPLTQALARKRSYVSPVLAGTRVMRQDHGQDYQGRPGQPVLAIGPGRVDAVKQDPSGFGTAVYYTLDNGQQLYVGHAQPTVRPGQRLQAGQPVAQLLAHGGGDASNLAGWTEVGLASGGAPAYPKEGGVGGAKFGDFLGSLGVPLAGGNTAPGGASAPAANPFAAALAQATGLSPGVTAAWQRAEGGPADNPLNIGPGQHFTNPVAATAAFLTTQDKAGYYKPILAAQTPAAQIAAIKASPWDAGHYSNGVLDRTFVEQPGAKLGAPAPAASSSAAGPQAPPSSRGADSRAFANTLLAATRSNGGLTPAALLMALRASTAHMRAGAV